MLTTSASLLALLRRKHQQKSPGAALRPRRRMSVLGSGAGVGGRAPTVDVDAAGRAEFTRARGNCFPVAGLQAFALQMFNTEPFH